MIQGTVTGEDVPMIQLLVSGRSWRAMIDTGFNGDLELPEALRATLNPAFILRDRSLLAGGQTIEEDIYDVTVPFDGETIVAEAAFVPGEEILAFPSVKCLPQSSPQYSSSNPQSPSAPPPE